MKKKLVLSAILLLGLLIVAALKGGSTTPDVSIVHGIHPFSRQVTPIEANLPDTDFRRYSLHMSFDEAVTRLDRELTPLGWVHVTHFGEATFQDVGLSPDWVHIQRGRLVDSEVTPVGSPTSVAGPPDRIAKMEEIAVPDAHGWITITTSRKIGWPRGLLGKLRWKLSMSHGVRGYYIVAPWPKKGDLDQPVDASKGTDTLEGKDRITVSFYKTDRYRP